MFRIVKNKIKGECQAHGCKNKDRPGKDRFCPKHRKRYEKHKNPYRYTFHILRSNARRRGHEFHLTIEEFKMFCKETGYMETKGKTPMASSIDRIDVSRGYSYSNIQIMSLSNNSKKGNHERNNEQPREQFGEQTFGPGYDPETPDGDCPF